MSVSTQTFSKVCESFSVLCVTPLTLATEQCLVSGFSGSSQCEQSLSAESPTLVHLEWLSRAQLDLATLLSPKGKRASA